MTFTKKEHLNNMHCVISTDARLIFNTTEPCLIHCYNAVSLDLEPFSIQHAALNKGTCINQIQTHKRFRITLLIRTKHNKRIFGVSPFIKLQSDT